MLVAGLGIACSCHAEANSCDCVQHGAAKGESHLLRLNLGEPHGARLFIEVLESEAFEQRQVVRPFLLLTVMCTPLSQLCDRAQ